jgi:glycerol-3-phosphate dehydrogenase
MDGVKRRTRAGMGRCQGGFCTPRVAAILARELGLSLDEVTKKGGASKLLLGRTKDILLSEEEAEAHA